jgi:hypothetical protein
MSSSRPVEIVPPIVVSVDPDCWFYRSAADALVAGSADRARVFDAHGQRLDFIDGGLRPSPENADGADELAEVLSRWLRYMDALRESTANWELSLLVQASVDHLGYTTD